MAGCGQEHGLRPGTLAAHQILGLSSALRRAAERFDTDRQRVATLEQRLIDGLSALLPVQVHGDPARTSSYILSLSIEGVTSDALINQLAQQLAIGSGSGSGSGSACGSGTIEPSHVLRAMGIEGDPLYGAVRISFSRDHTEADIDTAADCILSAVERIRELH